MQTLKILPGGSLHAFCNSGLEYIRTYVALRSIQSLEKYRPQSYSNQLRFQPPKILVTLGGQTLQPNGFGYIFMKRERNMIGKAICVGDLKY